MQLLVYANPITARKRYIFQFLFTHILGVQIKLSDNLEEFLSSSSPKLSYSLNALAKEIHFKETPFLTETEIRKQNLAFADFNQTQVPFPVKNSVFPFDVFAASFYLLSRYEEYISIKRDHHQRFEGKNSLAFNLGFINRPIIDEWALAIADEIKKQYPEFEIAQRDFQFIPTLDIDRPYYFKTDPFYKRVLKQLKLFKKTDPFDVYEQVKIWDAQFNLSTIYFILTGNQHQNDPAPSIKNNLFQKVIQKLAQTHQIGIHPSYFSHHQVEVVKQEKEELAKIAQTEITISRQHYLLLSLPKTYRDLIALGIKEDYTLAYADVAGFRAATCTPFFWYDLEKEEITSLLIHPTTVMDQTLRSYMSLSPAAAIQQIEELMWNVKKVNGTFISLWHNESVNNFGVWKDWKCVYLNMLEKAVDGRKMDKSI
ncbi:polysaccharide deacetylase family protein [Pedobacter cryophilus]|uniref:DUF7033 domain-containing protein n=1 Tax=Pedobacter cryophilus TaxID=2571271 RepID=A0A4U1CAJ4_9SPHI|nr:polysaccharide deacetylase family protein [Pedobacter cryophilus]TKC00718.1 hypothetical protein FA046_03310 [Pedobacter cryophilus]